MMMIEFGSFKEGVWDGFWGYSVPEQFIEISLCESDDIKII
jgi:hypothetical protein